MKILLLGYSDIARRRVLPALQALGGGHRIAVASRSHPVGSNGVAFNDYQTALDSMQPDLVYVSLVNSLHGEWAEKALQAGAHVVIDKPACSRFSDARRLVTLAAEKQRCLAEATVYAFHPQMVLAREAFREAGDSPQHLHATFTFPRLPSGNFRHQPALGGGALLDLGPYAVSVGRLFFNTTPDRLHCTPVGPRSPTGIETAFSAAFHYPDGQSCTGFFAFDGPYTNRIELIGHTLAVTIERAFTTPADSPTRLQLRHGNETRTQPAGTCDSFAGFFRAVLLSIACGDTAHWGATLLEDARTLQQLRDAARH